MDEHDFTASDSSIQKVLAVKNFPRSAEFGYHTPFAETLIPYSEVDINFS